MTHEREMLTDAVAGLIARHMASGGDSEDFDAPFDAPLWTALAEHGFTLVSVPEELGGSGGDVADAASVLRIAGATAAAVPLAETLLLGSWLLTRAGLPLPEQAPITVAPESDDLRVRRAGSGWHVEGTLPRVPWAADCERVVAFATDGSTTHVVSLPRSAYRGSLRANMAGERREDLMVGGELDDEDLAIAPDSVDRESLWRRGALARGIAMTGALERARDLTTTYVQQREQFGRPLARFQAVQQQLAEMIAEVAAAQAAVSAAVTAEDSGSPGLAAAIAKVRVGRSANTVAAIAHQLHGAIGVTDEYELHRFTRRLWAWRDEFGSEASWSAAIGRAIARQGAEELWPWLTSTQDGPDGS
jgi:acyl-CoA dehydrogenase